jgi:hypothetical protein
MKATIVAQLRMMAKQVASQRKSPNSRATVVPKKVNAAEQEPEDQKNQYEQANCQEGADSDHQKDEVAYEDQAHDYRHHQDNSEDDSGYWTMPVGEGEGRWGAWGAGGVARLMLSASRRAGPFEGQSPGTRV